MHTPEGKKLRIKLRVCQSLKVTKTQENQGRFGEGSEWKTAESCAVKAWEAQYSVQKCGVLSKV